MTRRLHWRIHDLERSSGVAIAHLLESMDSFLGSYLNSMAALAGGTFLRSIGTGELCTAQHPEHPPGHLGKLLETPLAP